MGINLADYQRLKAQMKEQLASKSKKEMQRRHAFFNADNEIFPASSANDSEDNSGDEMNAFDVALAEDKERLSEYQLETLSDDGQESEGGREQSKFIVENEPEEDEEDENAMPTSKENEIFADEISSSSSSSLDSSFVESVEEEEEIKEAENKINASEPSTIIEPELGFSSHAFAIGPEGASMSQDFNDALILCSGSFGPSSPTSTAKTYNFFENNDLFTVDDDETRNYVDISADFDSPDEDAVDVNEKEKRKLIMRDMFHDEASLSGDEIGSNDDADEGPDSPDEYEVEENDEILPTDDFIREDLARQYMKQRNDEEDRRLNKLMNYYLPDGELHSEKDNDRSFRNRMRNDIDIDWAKILGDLDENKAQMYEEDEEDAQASEVRNRKIEMLKWKLEQEKQKAKFPSNEVTSDVSEFSVGRSLLKLGETIAKRQRVSLNETPIVVEENSDILVVESVGRKVHSRDSILKNSNALGRLLKDSLCAMNSLPSSKNRARFLFTSGSQQQSNKPIKKV